MARSHADDPVNLDSEHSRNFGIALAVAESPFSLSLSVYSSHYCFQRAPCLRRA